jgi:hypothetical protein
VAPCGSGSAKLVLNISIYFHAATTVSILVLSFKFFYILISDYDISIFPLAEDDTHYTALNMNYSVAGFQARAPFTVLG